MGQMKQEPNKAHGESLPEKTEVAAFLVTGSIGRRCSLSAQVGNVIHQFHKRGANKAQPEGHHSMYTVCSVTVWPTIICRDKTIQEKMIELYPTVSAHDHKASITMKTSSVD